MRRGLILAVAIIATGCSSHSSLPAPTILQKVSQQTIPAGWKYIPLKRLGGETESSVGITTDGSKMWATVISSDGLHGALDKIALGGKVTQFPLNVVPYAIAFGPDKNFWLTTNSGVIAQVTPAGQETDFAVAQGMNLGSIVSGSDGALWFTECSQSAGGVGRIDLKGSYTFYPSVCPDVIASGPDGNIWFGDGPNIYSMSTQGESLGEYAVGDQGFSGIAVGSDGNIYVTGSNPLPDFSSVTMAGVVTHIGFDPNGDNMGSVAVGLNGLIWMGGSKHLLSFDTTTQTWVARIKSPPLGGHLCAGPGGDIWVTDNAARVDRYTVN